MLWFRDIVIVALEKCLVTSLQMNQHCSIIRQIEVIKNYSYLLLTQDATPIIRSQSQNHDDGSTTILLHSVQ